MHAAAILRHIARKVGLVSFTLLICSNLIGPSQYGTNYEEAALCDMWMEQIEEVSPRTVQSFSTHYHLGAKACLECGFSRGSK